MGAGQEQLTSPLVTHHAGARRPEPGRHHLEAPQARSRRARSSVCAGPPADASGLDSSTVSTTADQVRFGMAAM
jgi:hypothetical protein